MPWQSMASCNLSIYYFYFSTSLGAPGVGVRHTSQSNIPVYQVVPTIYQVVWHTGEVDASLTLYKGTINNRYHELINYTQRPLYLNLSLLTYEKNPK
jgi:hypothetical protein